MGRKWKEKQTFKANWNAYNVWLIRIMRLASSSIRWTGLPKYIDTIRLENILNRSGSAIIGYDETIDRYFVGQNASTGNIDVYGYPMDRRMIFANGETARFTPETSVIIYNNSMRMADYWIFQYFAMFMADMDVAIRVNMNTQKTMPIIPTTQEQQLSIENAYKDVLNNIPYILVDQNGFNVQQFKDAIQFDNRQSFTGDQMIAVQREMWNRCLTFIGINNTNVEKRERVNVQETVSNLDEILFMRRDRLNSRNMACSQMEMLWGWNVSAEYYSEGGVSTNGVLYGGGSDDMRTSVPGQDGDGGYSHTGRENGGADTE